MTILAVISSFYRYVVLQDFLVSYEIDCDPTTSYCFIGCEDDDCSEEYYYQEIERYAPSLIDLCGQNIDECEEAFTCTQDEVECSLVSCDPEDTNYECSEPNL